MAEANSKAINVPITEKRIDLLERRVEQVRAVRISLQAAMDNDSPVGNETVLVTVWAASELLQV